MAHLTLSAALFAGCSSNPGAVIDNPTPIPAAAYPEAFDASAAVLRDAGFEVDRRDYRFGRVTTQPKGSPTALEIWKPDNTTTGQAISSTLGDLRRTVTVSFAPDPQHAAEWIAAAEQQPPPAYPLSVEVMLERMQVPQRRLNGSTRGTVFADLAEVPTELQNRGVNQSYWQPIGRDPHLEQRLLQDILSRLP